jgi:hypothetical protein
VFQFEAHILISELNTQNLLELAGKTRQIRRHVNEFQTDKYSLEVISISANYINGINQPENLFLVGEIEGRQTHHYHFLNIHCSHQH